MTGAAVRRSRVAAALLFALPQPACTTAQQAGPASVSGIYDGSQTEIAAGLELGEDGRYRYAMSYGAVDEGSSGTWYPADGGIVLNSDPSTPPQFELLGNEASSGTRCMLTLHLVETGGVPISLFSAIAKRADGTASVFDFSEQDLEIPVCESGEVISVSLALPIYEVLGVPATVAKPGGGTLRFTFHPHDLGFKAFDHTLLPEKDGSFLLERYGREIAFRKIGD